MANNIQADAVQGRNSGRVLRAPEFSGLAGVARTEINPPAGIYSRTWGSARHDIAKGVHRPLLASCAVFADSNGKNELVLLALDLSWWRSKNEELSFREAILEGAGLQANQLILHLSHTHSAPSTAPQLADRPGGHLIAEFTDRIKQSCIGLVAKARTGLTPSILTWSTGTCHLAVNRDFVSPIDGSILVGLNPDAPTDSTLLVGRVTDARGKTQFTMVNYACHPTSLGGANQYTSSDYPGAMRETVERETDGAICIFLHGPSGDMTPRRSFGANLDHTDRNGRELGYATLATLMSMLPAGQALAYEGIEESGAALAVWNEQPSLPSGILKSRQITLSLEVADMPTRQELQDRITACKDRFMAERLGRRLLQRETIGDGKFSDFTVMVWQLGDAFIVALPAEGHTPFQIALRAQFPGTSISVLNIANGYLSYIPPEEDYSKNTYPVQVALFKAGAAEKIGAAVADAIRDMMQQSQPS